MPRRVTILAGAGAVFGSGHLRRMLEFGRWLRGRAWSVDFRLLREPRSAPVPSMVEATCHVADRDGHASNRRRGHKPSDILLLDARDCDPQPYLDSWARVIALDNRSPNRQALSETSRIEFYDTIPHPEVPLTEALAHCLLSPALGKMPRSARNHALVYAPTRSLGNYGAELLLALPEPERDFAEVRVFSTEEGGSAAEFYEVLAGARLLLAHFGQSMLEAALLGIPTVLWTLGSPVHATLARYLSSAVGLPVIDAFADRAQVDLGDPQPQKPSARQISRALRAAQETVKRGAFRPTADGFERLEEVLCRQ